VYVSLPGAINGPLAVPVSISVFGIETAALAPAVAGRPFVFDLKPAGGIAPYAWALEDGALPDGLTLSAAGRLSGTPATAGTFAFRARCASSNGRTAAQTFTLVVYLPPASTRIIGGGVKGTVIR
jgi:hypothetical protein